MTSATLVLLPDDAHAAAQIVRLANEVSALRQALRRTIEERDYWRARANRHDPDYQDGLGEYLLAARQEREHEASQS